MKKMIAWLKGHKRVSAALMAVMMVSVCAVGVSAESGTGGVSSDLSGFITSIKGALTDFTTTNLATILVAALSVSVGLAIAWFAFRFIKGKVVGAMKKGKV